MSNDLIYLFFIFLFAVLLIENTVFFVFEVDAAETMPAFLYFMTVVEMLSFTDR